MCKIYSMEDVLLRETGYVVELNDGEHGTTYYKEIVDDAVYFTAVAFNAHLFEKRHTAERAVAWLKEILDPTVVVNVCYTERRYNA
jgi:hypothetical protein